MMEFHFYAKKVEAFRVFHLFKVIIVEAYAVFRFKFLHLHWWNNIMVHKLRIITQRMIYRCYCLSAGHKNSLKKCQALLWNIFRHNYWMKLRNTFGNTECFRIWVIFIIQTIIIISLEIFLYFLFEAVILEIPPRCL